jgi:2-polyprenyl-6-hydroxyphenyl methylase/3-demethylubiquinone-9 3-methyltransferase
MQLISFRRPAQEHYKGRKVMADPGIHSAMEVQLKSRVEVGSRVLEIGCGEGAMTARLKDMGFKVVAVDIEDSIFDPISEVQFYKIGAQDKLTDIFGSGKFDAIVAIEVIEHVPSTRDFLAEAYRLLVPGGELHFTTPNISSFYSRIVFLKEGRFFHFQGEESWRMGHINPVPYFVIEQFAHDLGYEIGLRKGIGHMPILEFSRLRFRTLLMAIPRLLFYLLMRGPGPKEGNSLSYCLVKP